jgi:small-conductance mechanosensitive channel
MSDQENNKSEAVDKAVEAVTETLETVVNHEYFYNTLESWSYFGALSFIVLAALYITKMIVMTRLHGLVKGGSLDIFELTLKALKEKTHFAVMLVVSVFFGSQVLYLPDSLTNGLSNILLLAILFQFALWVITISDDWIQEYRRKRMEESPASATGMSLVSFLIKIAVWSGAGLLFLDNMGFDITALAAGLGIGGIAIALALQNILGDLFASLTIIFDKPFANGDFLIVGDHMGAVESIGLKTTRLRSLSGEQIVFSNTDLLGSRVRNYGRMYERRVAFKVGITYSATRDQIKKIPKIIQDAIEAEENTRFERSHFAEYGESSLDFESVYYVLAADYNLHMNIKQSVYLKIHEEFEKEGIEFAFPTQTVHVQNAA